MCILAIRLLFGIRVLWDGSVVATATKHCRDNDLFFAVGLFISRLAAEQQLQEQIVLRFEKLQIRQGALQ